MLSHRVAELLRAIEAQQCTNDPVFGTGLFGSYRHNPYWLGYRRLDVNVFFSAITAFTLRQVQGHLPAPEQAQVERIVAGVVNRLPEFQNKDGLLTYNFYRTNPTQHFSPGWVFRHFRHFKLPDDTDDTAMAYLIAPRSSAEAQWLHHKLAQHANGSSQTIRNTFAEYRHLKAYSTWFGQKMYLEFDACVLANALYCIRHYNLPLTVHDIDSLAYIESVILSGRYLHSPFRVAHQYPRSPLVVYHVARLLAAFDWPTLGPCRVKLIDDTHQLIKQTTCRLDFYLLAISLMRLGEPVAMQPPGSRGDFYFFIGGFLTAYEHPLLYRLASSSFFHVRWFCPAHELAIELEYEVLKQIHLTNKL